MSSKGKLSKSNIIMLVKTHLWKAAHWLAFLVLFLSTFSYHARLQSFTIRPIQAIAWDSDNPERLKVVLEIFRLKKQKELDFVRPAVYQPKAFTPETTTNTFIEHAICDCGDWSLLLAKRC